MSLKERIENNLTLFTLGLLFAGFVAGLGAYKGILEIAGPKLDTGTGTTSSWNELARKADWIPKTDCPAYPVSLAITSPGTGSSVGVVSDSLYTDLVIQVSRSLPSATAVGLVVNKEQDTNYYIIFPRSFKIDDGRKVFRDEQFVKMPFTPESKTTLNLWAIAVDDKLKLGSVYASLEQIKSSSSDVTLSEKIVINVR